MLHLWTHTTSQRIQHIPSNLYAKNTHLVGCNMAPGLFQALWTAKKCKCSGQRVPEEMKASFYLGFIWANALGIWSKGLICACDFFSNIGIA